MAAVLFTTIGSWGDLFPQLGVGVAVPWSRRRRGLGRAVRRALADEGLGRRATELAARIGPDDGAPAAADAIERF